MASTATRIDAPPARRASSSPSTASRVRIPIYQTLLIAGILILWEVLVRTGVAPVYLYGQPTGILQKLIALTTSGEGP